MNDREQEIVIDVRTMPPRERHPRIFTAWHELADGGSIVLVNDHDPLPLYYQFSCENAGHFHWEYFESGPDVWRVRITKGTFADPGFRPERPAATDCTTTSNATFAEPVVLDTRPLFHRGESPCQAIDEAVSTLIPGQTLTLLVPFEPRPLYGKLGAQGFQHKSRQTDDGSWSIEFRRV